MSDTLGYTGAIDAHGNPLPVTFRAAPDGGYEPPGGELGSAAHAVAITPHNTNDLATPTRALYVGGAGDVACITTGGETVTFVGLLAGVIYPFRLARVKATGTTATNLIGLY